jgi:uncharacterized protein DUF4054
VGVVVQFRYAAWSTLFPQFSNVSEAQIAGPVLAIAQQYSRNDGGGPVNDAGVQTQLLNLMVAHVAQLLYGSTTQPVSPLVGRVSDASEGSVSVSVEFPTNAGNAWFLQTQYGAMWWQMALPYRLGRYIPKITPQV